MKKTNKWEDTQDEGEIEMRKPYTREERKKVDIDGRIKVSEQTHEQTGGDVQMDEYRDRKKYKSKIRATVLILPEEQLAYDEIRLWSCQ
jgi:hypothetical protein